MPENSSPEIEPEIRNDTVAAPEQLSASLSVSAAITLCSLGLIVCFFMPWLNLVFVKLSGFHLIKEGGLLLGLWVIPVFALITAVAAFDQKSQRSAAVLTGLVPFGSLAIAIFSEGKSIISAFETGAYVGLALAFVLIVLGMASPRKG